MLRKLSRLALFAATAAFLASPIMVAGQAHAQQQVQQEQPAPKKAVKHHRAKGAKKVSSRGSVPKGGWTCYDYAWQSQAMKDCLAKQGAKGAKS
jgi:hypothetical protein